MSSQTPEVDAGFQPRLDSVMCASPFGTHRMAYWEWGDPDNPRVLLCVHGLTRTGRDFDTLARRLAADYRVVCPDIVGRGRSDWLANPAAYAIPQYVADILVLIARLGVRRVDWVGTSMGGLIALGLAGALAMSQASRPDRAGNGLPPEDTLALGRVVFNDVGPRLEVHGLGRIREYVGMPLQFSDFSQAVDYVRRMSEGFGPHTQAQWETLTRHIFLPQAGGWVKHYDVRIAEPLALQSPEVIQGFEPMLWNAYASLREDVLVLRGQTSDLLTADTAAEMLRRNPRARLWEAQGVGHAPTLMAREQVEQVAGFLLSPARPEA